MSDLGKALSNCVILLLFASSLFSSDIGIKLGDINADSTLEVHDMVSLVRCIAGKDSAVAAADLDHNGRVEFRDLLCYFNMILAMREKQPQAPQFVVAIGSHVLDSPSVDPGVRFSEQGFASADYRFIADRDLAQAELFVDPYVFESTTGRISDLHHTSNPDTISNGGSSSLKRWRATIRDSLGRFSMISGETRFNVYGKNLLVDYIYRLIGQPIEFTLVLHGPWQRFMLTAGLSYIVDLNPMGRDSVVFASLDSLGRAIMVNLLQRYPVPPEKNPEMIAGPAVPLDSTYTANRLIVIGPGWGNVKIEPLDGNARLLQQLGFPAWLRPELPLLRNQNYWFPQDWLEEYRYK